MMNRNNNNQDQYHDNSNDYKARIQSERHDEQQGKDAIKQQARAHSNWTQSCASSTAKTQNNPKSPLQLHKTTHTNAFFSKQHLSNSQISFLVSSGILQHFDTKKPDRFSFELLSVISLQIASLSFSFVFRFQNSFQSKRSLFFFWIFLSYK